MSVLNKLRFFLALWLGKLVFVLSRAAGKKGTTLPGTLTLKVYPQLIAFLAKQLSAGTIIVTGTNGKTTTSNMFAAILKESGANFTFNQAGSNLITGITTAFLQSTNWFGRVQTDLALLEVDEATVVKVVPLLKPHTVVITNFFRDQLDRYGELDKTVAMVKNTITTHVPGSKLVLNADDPLVAHIGVGHENTLYYGVAPSRYSTAQSSEAREARFCSLCGCAYEYQAFHYGQLGIYKCPGCGFGRPNPQVLAEGVESSPGGMSFQLKNITIDLHYQGFYNIYNALAPAAAALSMGIGIQTVKKALEEFLPQAGRMEQFLYGVHPITLNLIKNPTGFNEAIRTILHGEQELGLLIAINDNAADGRDISWLWDVDFENLQGRVKWVICSGTRAEDMAVRLKYAGVNPETLLVIKELSLALDKMISLIQGNLALYVLPTYTALFPMRDLMGKLRSRENAS